MKDEPTEAAVTEEEDKYINIKVPFPEWISFKAMALLEKKTISDWALTKIRQTLPKEELQNG